MNNFDKIKSMSIDEMVKAILILVKYGVCEFCTHRNNSELGCPYDCASSKTATKEIVMEWLESEHEGNE